MVQYIEINLIGIILLLLMFFYLSKMHHEAGDAELRLFSQMLLCNVAVLLTDIGIYLMRGNIGAWALALNHFFCVVYYLLHPVFGYMWFVYCRSRLYPEQKPSPRRHIISALPCAAAMLLVLFSPWTEWVYAIDPSDNLYMRGALMWAVIALSYIYWAAGAVMVTREMTLQRRNRERSLYLSLLIFPVPTIIGSITQLSFYGLSVIWIATAVSLLVEFIDLQSTQLSRDTLTGVYNRRQTNKQLAWELDHMSAGSLLFVVMIDVDHFKRINDRFGHLIGDKALVAVAGIITECAPPGAFVGRFGGDEFIVLGRTTSEGNAAALVSAIGDRVSAFNAQKNELFSLSLSMGCAEIHYGEKLTPDGLLSAADRDMYADKLKKNSAAIH